MFYSLVLARDKLVHCSLSTYKALPTTVSTHSYEVEEVEDEGGEGEGGRGEGGDYDELRSSESAAKGIARRRLGVMGEGSCEGEGRR